MASISLMLLGGFEARLAAGPPVSLPAKAQALLAYLALHPGQVHPRDKLAALLWGDAAQDRARDSLRHTVGALTTALDAATPSPLLRGGQTISVDAASVDVDVNAFERCVEDGAPAALERAVALYRGDLLEGLGVDEAPFEEWLLGERERLRELAIDALAALLAHQVKSESLERAIQTAVRLLALEPLQEPVHRTLMRLYVRRGRRGAALRQYQVCVTVLQRELGVDPEIETKQLYRDILQRGPRDPEELEAESARVSRAEPLPASLDVASPEAPMVGRDPERERLRQAVDETARGHGRVVTVAGEAGIGKTRLVGELTREALARGSRVLLGRSYESAQILSFGPWAEAFRTGPVLQVGKTLDAVWRAELARLLPELADADLPAASDDPLRLFEGVARLLTRLAENQPLALVLEDLHWADEMSLRLLAFLARRLAGTPVLVVATARDEELASAPTLRRLVAELADQPHSVNLALPPLSPEDTTTLVRTLARAGRDEREISRLAVQVWAASQGNPFVVVETMRALDHRPSEQELPLPDRVRQMTADRLERLSESSRHLGAVAAVIGREFEFGLLQRAADIGRREAAEGLEELVRRRVLHAVGERFDFTHDRIREVAYTSLLGPRRALLHGSVARALETLHAENLEPHSAALGTHYRESQTWDKAWPYLRRAGLQAAAHAAHREAVTCYEQALDALERIPENPETLGHAIDLRFDLRSSLFTLAEHRKIAEHLSQAEALATRLGDQRRLGWALRYVSNHHWMTGDLRRALEAGERGRAIAESRGDFDLQVATDFCTSQVHYARGDYRDGIELLTRTVHRLDGDHRHERFGFHSPLSVLARTWLLWCLAETGGFRDGIAVGEEALRLAEGSEHPEAALAARVGLGRLCLRQGDVPRATALFQEARDLCQRGQLVIWSGGVSMLLGATYGALGRLDEAVALLEPGPWRQRPFLAERATLLGEVHLAAGRVDEARELATHALEAARKSAERGREGWALRLLGEIESRRDRGEAGDAERHYRMAMTLASDLGMRPLVAQCRLGLGDLHRHRGNSARARTELGAALEDFCAMDMTSWSARAEATIAATHPPGAD